MLACTPSYTPTHLSPPPSPPALRFLIVRLMDNNLYASLAAQHRLDSSQKDQAFELAAFARMLSAMPDALSNSTNSWTMMCNAKAGTESTPASLSPSTSGMMTSSIPFDSPLDQSLGSPASTRDFQESPLQDYEFDFANMDAPLFPNHGTQQTQSDNLLTGLPLFGNELAFSQANKSALPSSQQTIPAPQAQTAAVNDFSFDAMARNMSDFANLNSNSFDDVSRAASPSAQSTASSFASGQDLNSINQLAAVFVREYARSHAVHDIDVLLRALRVAGIDVSDESVADILAAASISQSRSPSPSVTSSSLASSQGLATGMSSPSPSVSPMALPAAHHHGKARSSLQGSPKDAFAVESRHGKRFICPTCHKHFDRAFNLRTHALTHVAPDDREKPFMCPWSDCSKPFSRKYDAERHYRSVHVKRGEVASKKQVEMCLSGLHGLPSPLSTSSSVDQANG